VTDIFGLETFGKLMFIPCLETGRTYNACAETKL
jgi:hypothetical protein